jgi:hypothetical protein
MENRPRIYPPFEGQSQSVTYLRHDAEIVSAAHNDARFSKNPRQDAGAERMEVGKPDEDEIAFSNGPKHSAQAAPGKHGGQIRELHPLDRVPPGQDIVIDILEPRSFHFDEKDFHAFPA